MPANTGRHGGRSYDGERPMFLFRFDWALAARGGAYLKHSIVFVRPRKSRLKTAPTIYNNAINLLPFKITVLV